MKILDAFPFFNEVELLRIRLEMLYDNVDHFIISEANVTHTGKPKEYNFLRHGEDFEEFKDKIIFLQYEPDLSGLDFSIKDTSYNPSSAPWIIERGQRDFLHTAINTFDDEDLAFVCDLDEIWNPDLAEALKTQFTDHNLLRLEMDFHYYFMNCVGIGSGNSKWRHPYVAKVQYLRSNPNLSALRTGAQAPAIQQSGWHFSYLGGAQKISEKIDAFTHQETNTSEVNNLKHLQECVSLGIDHLGREDHDWAFKPLGRYPEKLSKIMRNHPNLIRSSLE